MATMVEKLMGYFIEEGFVDEDKVNNAESLLKSISNREHKVISLEDFEPESVIPANDMKWQLGISMKKENAHLYIYCGTKQVGKGNTLVKRHTGIKLSELFSDDNPLQYVKLFFLSGISILLKNKLIFYPILVFVIFRLIVWIFSLFTRRD